MPHKLILLSIAFCLAGPADAQVFRWTDKDGRVHYGDDPAPNARNPREVTATVNTLDTSGLRRLATESPPQTASNSSASAARPAANTLPRPQPSYPTCRRRR